MGNQWVYVLHLIFLSMFLVSATYVCLGAANITVGCSENERLALLKFKQSIKDDFKMLSSWVGIDCCSWEHVHCDGATRSVVGLQLRGNARDSYSCGGRSGSVMKITDIADGEGDNYLVGVDVNSSLAELRHLKYLDLSGNDFRGSRIPEFIGSLKQLNYLNLSKSGFGGNIPHHIGNLSNLNVLDLNSLAFSKELMADDMAWISGLSSLKHLDLNGVDLSGAQNRYMVLYMIPSFVKLSLSCCGFSNVDFVGSYLNVSRMLPNIKYLDLSCNRIGGKFPSVLANMSSLVSPDLSGNMLNSSIPIIPSLLKLDLSYNNIGSIVHIELWKWCKLKELIVLQSSVIGNMIWPSTNVSVCSQYALEMLDLSWNELNGSIPKSLGKLTRLRVLHLATNRLKGPIPESLGRLIMLEVLDLSFNQLDGPIPTFLGKLNKLDLSYNYLNGSIPKSFGSSACLTYLNLEYNRLTGRIPTTLGRLALLQEVILSSNMLSGTIPVSIGQLTKLFHLNVSNNSLEGVVFEAHFAELPRLTFLDLSSNMNLTFNVSREWIPPFQLFSIRLGSCKVSDEFPKWLHTQKELDELVLSNASISGPLPTWLQKIPIIRVLDLSHNKLTGPLTNLPQRIGFNDVHMGSLHLQDNLLNGPIQRSICTMAGLEILDLSKNRLSGRLPNCLVNLQNLHMMIFSSNEFSGVIPHFIGKFSPSLSWLNLNDNSFNGELPRDLRKLRSLKVLDLGDNDFTGKIPKWIGGKLYRLVVLRLHKNNFTGQIPHSLCEIPFLQILDVAQNNLTGQVPHCLGRLYELFDASHQHMGNGSFRTGENININVKQVMKGVDIEYSKTLDLVFNIDLSSNKLTGEIPEELMTHSLLVGLNLSHNHLSGAIPSKIGNMKAINSLDFSDNELTGMIPPSLASLNFLSHLNLSHNNLTGQIPTGDQLQTLTDPSIYAGNKDLCGAPLPKSCSNYKDPTTTKSKKKHKAADEPELWFYLGIMCGFPTGFWGVICVLLFKKRWRQKLFMLAEVTLDKLHITVMVSISKMKKKLRNHLDP